MEIEKNFTAKYKYNLRYSERVIRVLELINQEGEKKQLEFNARQWTDYRAFREHIADAGEFYFYDSVKNFQNFMFELGQQDVQDITVIENLGRLDWVTIVANNAIYSMGFKYMLDEDGIIKVRGENYKISKQQNKNCILVPQTKEISDDNDDCLLYTSPSPRD